MTADRVLILLLRANAVILLCAAPCALLPFAWMDAVDFVFETQSDDTLDVKVRANGFARLSDLVCFVRFETMQSKTVFVRVKCYRPDFESCSLRKIRVAISLRLAARSFLMVGICFGEFGEEL